MNKFINFINRLTFRQVIGLAIITGILIIIPATYWLNLQSRILTSRATIVPSLYPSPIIHGQPPDQPPIILGVKPYLGKIGDTVIIWGDHFGTNPTNSSLFIAGTLVDRIEYWQPTAIQFFIPNHAVSGNLTLKIGRWQVVWDKPLTIYSQTTPTKLSYFSGQIQLDQITNLKKLAIWSSFNQPPIKIELPQPLTIEQWFLPQKINQLQWIVLYDQHSGIIPFWQDPHQIP